MATFNADAVTGSKISHDVVAIYTDWTSAPVEITVAGTSDVNAADLDPGLYRVISTTACYFLAGTSASTATTSSHFLPAGIPEYAWVDGSDTTRFAVIQKSAGGIFQIHRITSRL